ncbi:MAG: hypothetical protein PHQ60_11095 [Sideroxydans sp.]|nr:hypothetical protein [Sideroxydans sp.]
MMNPENSFGRHSGEGRNPANKITLRSRQNQNFVPLRGNFLNHLDSGLRRNDVFFPMDYLG